MNTLEDHFTYGTDLGDPKSNFKQKRFVKILNENEVYNLKLMKKYGKKLEKVYNNYTKTETQIKVTYYSFCYSLFKHFRKLSENIENQEDLKNLEDYISVNCPKQFEEMTKDIEMEGWVL
jgi:hypothetical protein